MVTIAELKVDDWNRLNRLLEQALELEPHEREAWLAAPDIVDQHLRPILRSLLQQSEQETSRLDSERRWRPATEQAGDMIGPYRLVREIARGGMGVVWIAQRADGSFDRRVALKLPHAEWAAPGLAERMARERSILASLAHPNIAQLYDAGWTPEGRPFLALEYVQGAAIDTYCRERRLTVRERVRLFADVARAVAFAHTRLVVHRDLKPSNVMVTPDGSAKLLDFGIAKLLGGDRSPVGETALTHVGGRALTIPYAAPEQILGRPVSAATDVYSLGVMLFELLSGAKPYRLERPNSSAALEEAILSTEALPPSRVAARDSAELRGDLDTIVLKALKKAPEQRYDSAATLADDLDRYLAQQPIRARPDSRGYQTRMFIKRNRLPIAVAGGVFAVVLTGATIAAWQAHTARQEAQRAGAIKEFVLSIIRQADPMASAAMRDADLALLSAAEHRTAEEMKDQPEVVMELRLAIADAYANRGLMDRARTTLWRAIQDGRQVLPAHDPALAHARIKVAQNFVRSGEDELAELDAGIDTARSLGTRGQRMLVEGLLIRTATRYWASGSVEYERDITEAYELARTALGPGDPLTLQVACSIAWPSELKMDKRKVIEETYLAGQANPRVGESHPALLCAQVLYAYYLAKAGQADDAIPMIRAAIDTVRKHHGDGRPTEDVLTAAILAFSEARQLAAADGAAREAFRIAAARYPDGESIVGLRALNSISVTLQTRRVAEAGQVILTHARGGGVPMGERMREGWNQKFAYYWGSMLLLQGRTEEAEAVLADSVAWMEKKGLHHRWAGRTTWAWAVRENGRPDRALEILRAHPEQFVWDSDRQAHFNQLAASHLALGHHADAARLAAEAIAFDRSDPPFTPDGADSFLLRGRALLELGHAREAVESLAVADAFWRHFDPATPWAAEAAFWHGRGLLAVGEDGRGAAMIKASLPALQASSLPSHRAIASMPLR